MESEKLLRVCGEMISSLLYRLPRSFITHLIVKVTAVFLTYSKKFCVPFSSLLAMKKRIYLLLDGTES